MKIWWSYKEYENKSSYCTPNSRRCSGTIASAARNARRATMGRRRCYTESLVNRSHWFLPRCMKCRRGLAMRIFCLSVCLSHAWSLTKWKKDRSRFLYHTKEHYITLHSNYLEFIYPSFLRRRMVGGKRPILREILGQPTPRWKEIADFQPIIARSSSAVTPSEKKFN